MARPPGGGDSDHVLDSISVPSNHHKDMVIAIIVLISTLLCLYAFREKRMSKLQIENMSKDLLSLQQAEENLKAMQET